MRYLMLIYSNEAASNAAGPEVQGKVFAEYMALEKEMGQARVKLAGEALQPISTIGGGQEVIQSRRSERSTSRCREIVFPAEASDGPSAALPNDLGTSLVARGASRAQAHLWCGPSSSRFGT